MALTNKHRGVTVKWHFDSRFFEYQSEQWEIVGTCKGVDYTVENAVHTIKRVRDGVKRDIIMKELTKMLLFEMNNQIKVKAQ